jgi:hypothetical protein
VTWQVLIPTGLNFLGESKLPPTQRQVRIDKLRAHKSIFALTAAMAAAALGLVVVSIFGSALAVLIYAVVSSAALCCAAFFVLPRLLAKCNFYMFLASALYIQIDGALDYFYTSGPECVSTPTTPLPPQNTHTHTLSLRYDHHACLVWLLTAQLCAWWSQFFVYVLQHLERHCAGLLRATVCPYTCRLSAVVLGCLFSRPG